MLSSKLVNFTCIAVLSEIAFHLAKVIYNKFKNRKISGGNLTDCLIERFDPNLMNTQTSSGNAVFSTALFFPIERPLCKRQNAGRICRNKECPHGHEENSLSFLIEIIGMARYSIDVCVYMITSSILAETIIACRDRNIFIRIITDDKNSGEDGEVTGAQIGKLRAAGIPVRCSSSSFWMHHKFITLDNEVLINGSLNWTNQAILGNFENLLITSDERLVRAFVAEFKRLWDLLEPHLSS